MAILDLKELQWVQRHSAQSTALIALFRPLLAHVAHPCDTRARGWYVLHSVSVIRGHLEEKVQEHSQRGAEGEGSDGGHGRGGTQREGQHLASGCGGDGRASLGQRRPHCLLQPLTPCPPLLPQGGCQDEDVVHAYRQHQERDDLHHQWHYRA